MKAETERLNHLVNWYKVKIAKISEAPVDSRLGKLRRLYRTSERNKHLGVTVTSAGVINPVSYPKYPAELEIPKYESLVCVCPEEPCGIHEGSPFIEVALASSYTSDRTMHDPIDYFKKVVKSYRGRDEKLLSSLRKLRP